MRIDPKLKPSDLTKPLQRLFDLAGRKVRDIDRTWDVSRGTPVFTVEGKYTTRGWTEWTQGFVYGCAILTFDVTGDRALLKLGRDRTRRHMPPHITHVGVHDHGFNNLSTFGNLRRLMREGKFPHNEWENEYYELALKSSGAVQAARWQGIRVEKPSPLSANATQLGYIYSFNGPHSLFVDTMRTIRILGVAWQLGHRLMHENDRAADLLKRAVLHGLATNQYIIFHGQSQHTYDVRGRTAHEAIFNRNDGLFRCRSTQQGYSPFSTWTRGLAWAMLGYAEQLEFFATIPEGKFKQSVGLPRRDVMRVFTQAAVETSEHYIEDCSALDGITYWDDGAPGLAQLQGWRDRPADPFNDYEPVDASASAIAAQALLRLGRHLNKPRYTQAGLSIARTLLSDTYLATSPKHQGLLLHSIYHRPNGWDHVPKGRKIPCGESSMWGDYHLLELGVLLHRLSSGGRYLTFFD
ncbi:glycosyl hydrolase [Fontivita pretiosa]|uniref:glycosyl hydrolase n=1 Tax=Fontivita pretiosa TaxID=2989684 RepID=UPI003D182227